LDLGGEGAAAVTCEETEGDAGLRFEVIEGLAEEGVSDGQGGGDDRGVEGGVGGVGVGISALEIEGTDGDVLVLADGDPMTSADDGAEGVDAAAALVVEKSAGGRGGAGAGEGEGVATIRWEAFDGGDEGDSLGEENREILLTAGIATCGAAHL